MCKVLKVVFFCSLISCLCLQASAASYYCDPATGSMANIGSFSSPWSTLQAVFSANKSFQPGDTIFLRNGYHGMPIVKGLNTGYVTIQPQSGHVPMLRRLTVTDGKNWIISGLKISPVYAGIHEKTTYVTISAGSSFITLKNCNVSAMHPDSVAIWPADTVRARMGDGIFVRGRNCFITEDTIRETYFALQVVKTATGSVASKNYILHFGGDGMRGLADSCNFEYNKVLGHYSFPGDQNHPDGFQSWSLNSSNVVGADTVKNVVIRGNTIINLIDRNQPFANDNPTAGLQGIGNFDGFSKNWLIENNLIVTNMWHGIALLGAVNCKIINNTVMPNPMRLNNYRPWITVGKHKNGESGFGNVVMNNLIFENSNDYDGTTLVSNLLSKDTLGHFVDFRNLDFHLKATSTAVNAGMAYHAGTNTSAPTIDLDKAERSLSYEIGAYEYNAVLPVSLHGFSGEARGKDNILHWYTASEINNTGFEVLHSADGRFFDILGFVPTKANNGYSAEMLQYGFTDGNNNATTYYQLRQMDKDGKYSLSPVVVIRGNVNRAVVTFSPNPVGNTLTIKYGTSALAGKRVKIKLSDIKGRKVKEIVRTVSSQGGTNVIDVSGLLAGVYFLDIVYDTENIVSTKLIKW